MLTQYINTSQPTDVCEQVSGLLLTPAVIAFGRRIDIQTGLVLPAHPIIIRVAAAVVAILLFPVTVLGIALQSISATHWQHADTHKTSFKPIALVVAGFNTAVMHRLLPDTIEACREIGQSNPLVAVWESKSEGGEFLQKSESEGEPDTVLDATDLFNDHTVILLSEAPASWRVFRAYAHDGDFSSVPTAVPTDLASTAFALFMHTPAQWSFGRNWNFLNDDAPTYVIRQYETIPYVVKEILERQTTVAANEDEGLDSESLTETTP